MSIHLVGGFLGSGKTTAIVTAARRLMARGHKVGVVTNDQGKYLVDTAFFRALAVPAVEVTGGCFCCNYDDLDEQLSQLAAQAQPDVIFAESVGSCADVVATVLKPLLQLSQRSASLSVFTDSRLLLRRLRGQELPFADDVVYIFDQQIEEAGLLVINKADLLGAEDRAVLAEAAAAAYPAKRLILQDSRCVEDIAHWLQLLEAPSSAQPLASLNIDYPRYGAGEADLAWLDARIDLRVPPGSATTIINAFLTTFYDHLRAEGLAIGHIKLLADDGVTSTKLSLTAADSLDSIPAVSSSLGETVHLVLNARAQAEAAHLEAMAKAALEHTLGAGQLIRWDAQHFHPAMPRPTHRFA